jgi:hypothetical protein
MLSSDRHPTVTTPPPAAPHVSLCAYPKNPSPKENPNTMKKFLAAVATVFIAVALSVVAVAGPASAHTATFSGSVSCNSADGSGTIVWKVVNDYAETLNVTASDNATIPVNTTVDATSGHGDTSKTFTQHIPAPAAGVSVTTTLSFLWSGDNFTQTGTKDTEKISSDCKVPTPKDASAALIDTPAACAAAETVALGTATNASWGTLTVSNGHYHAVATATGGHVFGSANGGTLSAGNTVDTFIGSLDSALSPTRCQLASAAVVTTAASCQGPSTATEDTAGIKFATWTPITYKTTAGVTTYTAIANAQSGYQFPNGSGVSNNNTKLTLTGTIAGEITGHPCEDYIIVAWTMPSWVNSTTPTWSQTYFTSHEESTPDLNALDSQLSVKCGVQYQVDIYYNSPTTASLIAGTVLNGPNSPPEDLIPGGWGTAYKLVQGPACATPVAPSESDVCTAGGTITVYAATGVNYFLNGTPVDTHNGNVTLTGLHGVNTVTATAASGYLLKGYPAGGWSYTINSNCAATYASSGDCTASSSTSQESVTLNLVNTSGTAATFVVTSTDSTVTAPGSYNVPAHTTSKALVGTTTQAGGTFNVSVNGGTAIAVPVASFQGCIQVTPADPTFTQLACTGSTTDLGSITTDGNALLVYTLDGPNNTGTVFPGLPTPTISGLSAGTYVVNVSPAPNSGVVISTPSHFPFTIQLAPVNCIGTQQTPVVTFVAPTCTPNPVNTPAAGFTADLTEVKGTITIPDDTLMSFTISDGTTTTAAPTGKYIEPDGTYTVVATLRATPIANGFTFGPSAGYTRSAGNTVATFTAIEFTSECGLPTLASWHSGATGDPATCTLTGGALGTITVVHGSDAAHPTDENGKVTYTLVNNGNGHTTNLGSTASTVNVAPGSYTVEATPTDPADGLVGNPNVTNEIDYPVTIAAPAGSCGDRLAFTGGTIAWFGFILAGGMLFLGIAFLLIRRRGDRTAE